jgi:hypothetical protein
MVSTKPPFQTAIQAPTSRGTDPRVACTVISTASWLARRAKRIEIEFTKGNLLSAKLSEKRQKMVQSMPITKF